ncbi:hypothetical protein CFSAN002369_06226 [Clostridium botulinum CFSAN002369]|nr:hypothetical protein CFSAN002369_06226 [Clostridium botulinum CFSAN002369]
MSFSNNPNVLGFVSISPAISSFKTFLSSSIETLPSSPDFISTMSNPATDALAGFVPCAESGTIIFVLFVSPLFSW